MVSLKGSDGFGSAGFGLSLSATNGIRPASARLELLKQTERMPSKFFCCCTPTTKKATNKSEIFLERFLHAESSFRTRIPARYILLM